MTGLYRSKTKQIWTMPKNVRAIKFLKQARKEQPHQPKEAGNEITLHGRNSLDEPVWIELES